MEKHEKILMIIKDIIIPLVVGVSSIIVALYANKIAERTSETARLQALIAKNTELPTIVVEKKERYDFRDAFDIDISITDGKYSNYTSEIISFLVFDFKGYTKEHYWVTFDKAVIPMIFFCTYYSSPEILYGEIQAWESDKWERINDLRYKCETSSFEIEQRAQSLYSWPTLETSIDTYLKITYLNLLEEEETVYYGISTYCSSVMQIKQDQGIELFEMNEEMWRNGSYLRDYTVDEAFRLIENFYDPENDYHYIDYFRE